MDIACATIAALSQVLPFAKQTQLHWSGAVLSLAQALLLVHMQSEASCAYYVGSNCLITWLVRPVNPIEANTSLHDQLKHNTHNITLDNCRKEVSSFKDRTLAQV